MSNRYGYEKNVLDDRLSIFLNDLQRGKMVVLKLSSCESDDAKCPPEIVVIGPSSEGGVIVEDVVLKSPKLKAAKEIIVKVDRNDATGGNSMSTCSPNAVCAGNADSALNIPIIPFDGVSIISDIDDTIKNTGVGNIPKLLESTFAKKFSEVDGMSAAYRRLIGIKNGKDIEISQREVFGLNKYVHYVSSSPWPMASTLSSWISSAGFPPGSLHLKSFRLELFEPWGVDLSFFNIFKNPLKYKMTSISTILGNFPGAKACFKSLYKFYIFLFKVVVGLINAIDISVTLTFRT